jgi:hypothetical protein
MATSPTLDPDRPADNSPLDAGEMRNQFGGIQWRFDKAATPQPLGLTVSNPPTQAEMQAIADKLDEVIGGLQAM